ncbi:MAG TPA: transglutaminase-like domain-containing protein, partial [Planctomycetota bacterium]|nr:transglutaminase-like domain-containing protein [Planctomycetota bacterium]
VELRADLPPLVLRRPSERTSTDDLAYRVMTGREVLTFRVDKPIGLLDRVQKLSVKLEWKDPPLAELQLEDARQRLVSHSHTNGQHVALVEVSQPAEKAHSEVILPVTDPTFAAYLAETIYVKPRHPAILAAARAALAGETKAEAAVNLLSKWVHDHIEGQLVAGTLSGPEVLTAKRGKCTEYATLFASLARAVGIPTRMALGERLMGESWMGHMWNEAWVGRWVTVDASVNEVDHSLALLKFVHSDTVMGTQSARWKLTKSLAISIDEIERVTSDLEQRYQTGLVDGTYTNSDFACRISAVGEGWQVKDQSQDGVVTVAFRHEKAPSAFFHFVAFAVPEGTKPKAILDARKPMFTKNYRDFELLESKSSQISDSAAQMWRFRGKPKTNAELTNGHTEYVWIRGSRGFLMNMITLDKNSDADRAYLDALLASFEFLK